MFRNLIGLLTVTLLWSSPSLAKPKAKAKPNSPTMDAAQIVQKAMARNLFGLSGTANAIMTIQNARGETKTRDLAVKLMRSKAGLQRALVTFRSPVEVAGTAFLVNERPDGLPDQYLYLPALKKVRRIAAGHATDSFMGSDFTYMDLSPLPQATEEQASYVRLADADVGGQPAYVIEAKINIPGSPYSKIVTYVHRDYLVPLKIEFFDPFAKPLKTATMKKLKKVNDRLIPVAMEMKNLQKGSSTLLSLTQLNLKAKLSEDAFTPEAMQN